MVGISLHQRRPAVGSDVVKIRRRDD